MNRTVSGDQILVLIGGDAPAEPMAWASVRADGTVSEKSASEDPPAARPSRTVLVLPGAEAHTRRLELPASTEAQARAAAAILFEGELADTDEVHCAIGEAQDESGHRLVAAISQRRLRDWLAQCKLLGAEPEFVTLDFMLRPVEDGEVEIFEAEGRTCVAGGAIGGFAIESDLAPALFPRWLQHAGVRPASVRYTGPDATPWRAIVPALQTRAAADPIAALARGAACPPPLAVNLRQGDFAPSSAKPKSWRLRVAVSLALAAMLLQIGAQVLAGWRDESAAATTLAAAERDFRTARPDVRRIVNLSAQSAALVNALRQSQSHPVIAVTEPLIRALQTQPLAQIEELIHEAPERSVRVRLSAPQAQLLEQVANALRGEGVKVEARELQPIGGRYSAEFLVEVQK